jgi:hypothetical protein
MGRAGSNQNSDGVTAFARKYGLDRTRGVDQRRDDRRRDPPALARNREILERLGAA